MIKTKEHNFLGDSFTNNIKYADNAWQAYGNVDRASMFMPQSILDSIFEETEYDNDVGRFVKFLPRYSVEGDPVANTLPHDLILLDKQFYDSASENSVNILVNSITTALTKGINIVNPLYDVASKYKLIKIFEGANLHSIRVSDFLKAICPVDQVIVADAVSSYAKVLLKNLATRYGTLPENKDVEGLLNGYLDELVGSSTEMFVEDFSLRLHERESIKLPFYKFDHKSSSLKTSDLARYLTRFYSNIYCTRMTRGDVANPTKFGYAESLSNIVEEKLAATYFMSNTDKFYSVPAAAGRPSANGDISLDNYVYNTPDEDYTTLADSLDSLMSMVTDVKSYFTGVYVNASAEVIQGGRGLYLSQEVDKAAVLKEDDTDNYALYSGCSIGYQLLDDLLSQRTFLGTINHWSISDDSSTEVDLVNIVVNSNKLSSWDVIEKYRNANASISGSKYSTNYVTVCSLISLFALAAGKEPVFADLQNINRKTANELIIDDTNKGLYDWLKNECFVFSAPIFGDLVESLEFQQDLNEQANVDFKNLRLSAKPAIRNSYPDSLTDLPYVEQTMPLINHDEVNEDAVASKYLPGTGGVKLDPLGSNNITPPFIHDYHKQNEAVVKTYDSKTGQKLYNSEGQLLAEGGIVSPTITALWEYIKYLSEDENAEALPSFYGLDSSVLGAATLDDNTRKPGVTNDQVIDILSWDIKTDSSLKLDYSNGADAEVKELLPGGYEVTRYIQKVYDYKVDFYSRADDGIEGYTANIEGYLESVQNLIDVALGLTSSKNLIPSESTGFTKAMDDLVDGFDTGSTNKIELAEKNYNIIDFSDNYKKYNEHPKNLKTIERELEALRQNLRALSKFTTLNYIPLGVLDRNINRGNLHLLHRDAGSTFTDCLLSEVALDGNYGGHYDNDSMLNQVIFDGASLIERYKIKNFSSKSLTQTTSGADYVLAEKDRHLEVNTTELKDVYLGADGLWHSIHEIVICPIVDDWNEWLED